MGESTCQAFKRLELGRTLLKSVDEQLDYVADISDVSGNAVSRELFFLLEVVCVVVHWPSLSQWKPAYLCEN